MRMLYSMRLAIAASAMWGAVGPALADDAAADFGRCAVAKDRSGARELIARLPADRILPDAGTVRLAGCAAPATANSKAIRAALIEAFYKRDFVEFGLQPRKLRSDFLSFDPVTDGDGSKAALAMCVTRSTPKLTDRLLATRPGSAAEESVMQLVMPYFTACQANGTKTALIKSELRGLIAQGAYMVSVRYWAGEMRAIGVQ